MSAKNVWLLSLFVLALAAFGGFVVNTAGAALPAYKIDTIDIEGTDIDGKPSRDEYSIRGVRVWVEGEIDDRDDKDLGNLKIHRSSDGANMANDITVKRGVLTGTNPGHDLLGTKGTRVDNNSEITTNVDGEFYLSFILPFNSVGSANEILYIYFTETADGQFNRVRDAKDQFVKYYVQVPRYNDADVDDRVYRNGDEIQVSLEMETDPNWSEGAPPTLVPAAGRGIEVLTMLPDFSNVDSKFAGGNSKDSQGNPLVPIGKMPNVTTGRYNLASWNTNNAPNQPGTDPNALDLYDLFLDVDRAIREGRLIIEDGGRGDYEIRYTISDNNVNDPGLKRVFVYALDYPSVLTASGVRHDMLSAPQVFAAAGLAFPGNLNIATWYTTKDMDIPPDGRPDTEDINLDNAAPNFDFAIVNPFVNPPCFKWVDVDGDGIKDPDEWVYIYKEGSTVSVMLQIDPHDLTTEELEEIDPDQIFPDGNEDATIDNIRVVGDISQLLDPTKVDLTTDANRNGIPDRAEVLAYYAGSGGSSVSGSDDDFDGEADGVEDEEDKTTNGFDERLLFVINFVVDGTFKGVSGTGAAVTEALAFRFLIEDAAGNITRYSAWREELYNPDLNKWRLVSEANWPRDAGLVEPGVQEPVFVDDVFYPNGMPGSAFQYPPTPQRAKMPPWSNGFKVLENWSRPWRIQIDSAAPSISKYDDLLLEVPPAGQLVNGPVAPVVVGGTSVLATGNFIYEIGGRDLVTFQASFPSDNDVEYVKFMYSDSGNTGSFREMKGQYTGDTNVPGLFDMLGVQRDPGVPGAMEGLWHDGVNGDDDNDRDADFNDRQVYAADRTPQRDGVDNDVDGLIDANDVDDLGRNADLYAAERDDDEDGIMDEDEFVVKVVNGVARWSFDPVRVARILRLLPDRAYAIKAFAYDCAGNAVEKAAAPIYVVFRVTGKGLQEVTGTASAKLYKDNQLVTQKLIPENRVYDLLATTTGMVNDVTFQYSNDKKKWVNIPTTCLNVTSTIDECNPDNSAPFKISWRPSLAVIKVPFPDYVSRPDQVDDLYIRAVAGKFGNLGRYQVTSGLTIDPQGFAAYPYGIIVPVPEAEQPPDITVGVTDSASPVMIITQLGLDVDLSRDGIDNDGNGQIDDPGENGIADGALVPIATDVILKAYTTAPDVVRAIWQSAKVFPDGTRAQWVDIPCTTDVTALPNGGYNIVSRWDTAAWTQNPATPAGRYAIRCVAVDGAGNSDPQLAPIAHVIVGFGKKAAFIVDPYAGKEISGSSYTLVARVYDDWDKNDDGIISAAEKAAVANEIVRVIFQYRKAGGPWIVASSVEAVYDVKPSYAEWRGNLSLYDLTGNYEVRASVQDDKGYVTNGIEVPFKVTGISQYRMKVSNFESDASSNPRVSMRIASSGAVPDIKIEGRNNPVQTLRVVLKAAQLPGTSEPPDIMFQYKINSTGVNPKDDDAGWTDIAKDDAAAWEKEWDIGENHPLHKLQVSTLVYVRALAFEDKNGNGAMDAGEALDKYVDEGNFVPFVGMIFEETTEPTCTIERIERDGVTVGELTAEKRVTGGVLTFYPNVFDNHPLGNPQELSAIAQVDLYYKLCIDPSRDGDTLKWQLVGSDTQAPFAINWNIANVPTSKYDVMLVAIDQAGNKSANVWNDIGDLRSKGLVKVLTIDHTGPTAYIEDPDGMSRGGRLGCGERNVLISVSSYEGCIAKIELYYNTGQAGLSYEELEETVTIRRIYQDQNNNGVWDPGEPYVWELPGPGEGEFLPDVPPTAGGWVKIGDKDFAIPSEALNGIRVSSNFGSDPTAYYYYDENGNKRFDAGEVVWKDVVGGNSGRYNSSKHILSDPEPIIMGGIRPPDEAWGRKFQDIPAEIKHLTCTDAAVTKWVDVDPDGSGPLTFNGVLDDRDFIWVDMDGDNKYDCVNGGVGEPVVYASDTINWDTIMDLPPTNDTGFDVRAKASDKDDSAGKAGNWGIEKILTIKVENIVVAVWNINGRAVENNYNEAIGGGKDYGNEYQRVTGNTVTSVIRVWPHPREGAEVQLLYRYDDDLYPGGPDSTYNGYPDNGNIANSRWDGIDNDFDGVVDEEQRDVDGNDVKWGEVNVWRRASTTGGTSVTNESAGAAADGPDKNWFEVTLTWNVSDFKGEFQYQFLPVVVDGRGYGPNLNYAGLPFTRSDAKFPQTYLYTSCAQRPKGYRVIIDHQGPYTYTQVVKDRKDYGDDKYAIDSWEPLTDCGAQDIIIRTNDGPPGNPNDKRKGNGDFIDDPGEDNYTTYDIQGKVVSIYGGLSYTKTFTDTTGGVEFQYRVAGGQWQTLGYDYDPDYMSTFVSDGQKMVSGPIERGLPIDKVHMGAMIPYTGRWVNNGGGYTSGILTTNTQREVVTTWSLDNVDISNFTKFPPANGAEYEFRVIAVDLPDVYGGGNTATAATDTTTFDELVVENRIGDGLDIAATDQNFMRDINWKLGVPYETMPTNLPQDVKDVLARKELFNNLHVDRANLEYVTGPRDDGDRAHGSYWVNNLVPQAEIIRVDEKTFNWAAATGVDPVSRAEKIDAAVHQGEDVLVEAIVNPDPLGKIGGVWSTTEAGDVSNMNIYARPHPLVADTNPDYYKNFPSGGNVKANGWMKVGMGYVDSTVDYRGDRGTGYTIRIDTDKLVDALTEEAAYTAKGVPSDTREFELMALAQDSNCNYEPFMTASGEVIIRVLDMVGPSIQVGGLALDMEHIRAMINRLEPVGGGIVVALLEPFLNFNFTDLAGLDLNNFGNALFPSSPNIGDPTPRRPVAKFSGEQLQLYVASTAYADVDNVSVAVYDRNNAVVAQPTVTYAKDTWKTSTETNPGHEVVAGVVSHAFILSEQTALLYLPTWKETAGNKSRFEGVRLYYSFSNNQVAQVGGKWTGSGSPVAPPNPPFGDYKNMAVSINSNGDRVWNVNLDIPLGKTCFYYFRVDTVGDIWVIPDPKNLMADEFINEGVYGGRFDSWFNNGPGAYIAQKNIFLNLPVVSKIWMPGTPAESVGAYARQADDEIWVTSINLNVLPDGVYEIRVIAKDKLGYSAMVSKTVVVDRTAPNVPNMNVQLPKNRVKANSTVPLVAVVPDGTGINAVETIGVLFQASRRGNTQEAVSTWQYAISPGVFPPVQIPIPPEWQGILPGDIPAWLGKIALDPFSFDGWMVNWQTPNTDQNVRWFVRAVPYDDAFNVQVSQTNQVDVVVDGTVPKAKVVKAKTVRAGVPVEGGADGFELYPNDKDVTLTAEMTANIDGDLDNDGIIELDAGENINLGLDSVLFQYSLKNMINPNDENSAIEWVTIPAYQYSDALRAPNADGKWQVTWQVDFSQLVNEKTDQYIHVRAVATDQVGNKDDKDPILSIMVLNNTVGPKAYIRFVDGRNVLDPHLAVTKRCFGTGDPGSVDVEIEARYVPVVTLQYRKAGDTNWIPVETKTGVSGPFIIEWPVASLTEGRYELRVAAYDGDGNMMLEPDVVVVIVDHTEPVVMQTKMKYKIGDDWFEVYPGDGRGIYRYADSAGTPYEVAFEAKVDATDPEDKVEAKAVKLEYWDKGSAIWKPVPNSSFSYSKTTDLWTMSFSRTSNPLAAIVAAKMNGGTECGGWLRILAEDYACNTNKLDKGFAIKPDATSPEILAVYSGSREWEGGERPTIVAEAGNTVDLWAKIRDDCTGPSSVTFKIPASDSNNTSITSPAQLPVLANTTNDIGSGVLVEEHGGEALFHLVWTTPRNMAYDNYVYDITISTSDAAGNSASSTDIYKHVAKVKVERDETPPAAPEIRFLVTHAAGATGVDNSGNVSARIFDEYSAPWYWGELNADGTPNYAVNAPVRKIVDLAAPAKYNVFDTYNDWTKQGDNYITVDDLDTAVEIWVRTSELEYGVVSDGDKKTWRQYESYSAINASAPGGMTDYPGGGTHDPKYIPVSYAAMGHDPGIIRVYMEMARDPNQDGKWDDSAQASWTPLDNYHETNGDGNQKYRRPTALDADEWKNTEDWGPAYPLYMGAYRSAWSGFTYSWNNDEHKINRRQEPLLLDDVYRVPVYEDAGTDKLKGFAYYWVMGDDSLKKAANGQNGETLWNTAATSGDDGEVMDSSIGKDGWYIIRTWAEDYAGNGNPYKDAERRNFGYAMVYVRNQDDIPPVGSFEVSYDEKNTSSERVVWEGWHKVQLRTKTAKPAGFDWNTGSVSHITNVSTNAPNLLKFNNRFCKLFADIDFVAIQAQDPVSGNWVDIGFSTESHKTEAMTDGTADRYSDWYAWVDSTWVEDGKSKLRVVMVDNGGLLTDGYKDVHKQNQDGRHIPGELERRNYQDRGTNTESDLSIDNPRGKVVLPASGAIVDRGKTITIQALPFSMYDEARNGHDVGRVYFLARRKSVSGQLYNGPWILIDALDNDLDGRFGEDPVDGLDLDKDLRYGEDGIDPVDTNEPYLVKWTVPEWLVIDEPRTSAVETTAEYYIVAVAGDAETGPLSELRYGTSWPWPSNVALGIDDQWWVFNQPTAPQYGQPVVWSDFAALPGGRLYYAPYLHFDNPEHIISHTDRFSLVTVQDTTPPRTRMLQVDKYAVPSETKIIVGRTVTVYAGDTEVLAIPPAVFPWMDGYNSSGVVDVDTEGTYGLLMPPYNTDVSGLYYNPNWTKSELWGGRYSTWPVPFLFSDHRSNLAYYWPNAYIYTDISNMYIHTGPNDRGAFEAEWRPNGRVQLMYASAQPDGSAPPMPQSGQTWADTAWKLAEADAIDMDDMGNPGKPDWQVTNWVTGDDESSMPDGKYYVTIVATDDVGHTTGIPVGTAPAVMPDMVSIYIDNHGPTVTMTASELKADGTLAVVTNNQMERGQPLVLSIDPKMAVEDLDKVTFQYKAKHDYDWTTIQVRVDGVFRPVIIETQPYSVTLSPLGAWSGITNQPQNIALGNIYQFRALAEDSIGNKAESNIIELTVVDKLAEASIARVRRLDGFNDDETLLKPQQISVPRLTGKVRFTGFTDADVVGVTFLYRAQGTEPWIEIEAKLNRFGPDGWEAAEWINDGIDNDEDTLVDEPGECGYEYEGKQMWRVVWDTTTLKDGAYELAVVANTGENKSNVSKILRVIVDHNAYDILAGITDSSPKSGQAVGGWTRRPVTSQNPILDPDDKQACRSRGEVDLFVTFASGIPADLDMGVSTGVIRDRNRQSDDDDCDICPPDVDEFDENLLPNGTALMPSLTFEYKESAYPDIGDETINEKPNMDQSHWYWKPIRCAVAQQRNPDGSCTFTYGEGGQCVVYDAATGKFSTVWHTVADEILNGYYDIRVRVVDEAGNVAYKIIAERVIVDNTPPEAMITNIDGDTTLTYVDQGVSMATDTELSQSGSVVVKATAIDSLTSVHSVQFQVRQYTIQSGRSLPGGADEINLVALNLTEWTDIGLLTKDANPANSYTLRWNTTGLLEGDYLLRVGVTDVLGNKMFSGAVKVTVVDTTPPVATIVGYYPDQMQFLRFVWPKKPRFDNIYAATICQVDVQEVQIQYRSASDPNWITIGVPTLIPFQQLDSPEDKADIVRFIYRKELFPLSVKLDDMINEAFDWTGLWGTTWDPKLPDGTYQLRAVAKDWSGNVDPGLAPILTVQVVNGVVQPVTPASGMKINFTANLGGTGVGDIVYIDGSSYKNIPTVVLTVEAPEKPTVLVLVEVDSPEGLVYGGEIVDVKPEEGAIGRYTAALKGDELQVWIANQYVPLNNYLELLKLGGKITAFATTSAGTVSTTLTMDDLRVFPVTPELGTNGTVFSKDSVVSLNVPRAALYEPPVSGTYAERAGVMITPTITPNTPKDQRLQIEPVGQAYSIEMFNWLPSLYYGFRPGFEPKFTIDYSSFGLSAADEVMGFVSVRYWEPLIGGGGRWANDDIINLLVDEKTKKITFNLKNFGRDIYWLADGTAVYGDGDTKVASYIRVDAIPHHIFSIVLEKSMGRVDQVVLEYGYQYPDEPDITYMRGLGNVFFRIVDPAGIDESNIRVYVDGQLHASGLERNVLERVRIEENGNRVYKFVSPIKLNENLTEGFHTLRVEAWDKSDAVNESNWMMLEKTVRFYVDRTSPLVVTHSAQVDGKRWFSNVQGAVASITMVDEGVGIDPASGMQDMIYVDVFKYLNSGNTPMRTLDQGNIINYQRKVLLATSEPVLEYCDDYTNDGIDNETWHGIYPADTKAGANGSTGKRHKAWRASYNLQPGQIADGDTFEVVFYNSKLWPTLGTLDLHNENAVYLYEDLTKAYFAVWDGANASNLTVDASTTLTGIVSVPATQVPDFYKLGIQNLSFARDPFVGYYQGSFLVDILGNGGWWGAGVRSSSASSTSSDVDGGNLANIAMNNVINTGTIADTSISSTAITNSGVMTSVSDGSSGTASDISRLPTAPQGVFFVRQLVADTRGPVASLDVPTGVRADQDAATVFGSATDDGSGIASARLVINGTVVAEKKGPASSISLEYSFGKGEAKRANEIKLVVVDMAGNEVVKRADFGVQEVDSPVISGMAPSGDGIADATPTISASYADVSGIDLSSITMTLNGAVITDATVGASMVSYTPLKPLKAGVTYTVKVALKDAAGASAEAIWTFSLETVLPSITDTTPSGVDQTGMPVISAKFKDAGTGIDKDTVRLMLDNKLVDAAVTESSASYKPSDVLAKGKHIAELTVADMAGNIASLSWDFSIEETAPSVTNVEPTGTINNDMPILSARYSDAGTGVDLSSVTMSLNGEVVRATVTNAQVSYGVQEPLKPGVNYTVAVTVADKAGNVGSASSSFKLEGTEPNISGMAPTGTVQSVDVAISANYSDAGSGIDQSTALMKVDGVVVPATPSASGISYQATGLMAGDHTVYVEIADRFGNPASRSWSFKVEQTPPTISSVGPSGEVNIATPVLTASYSDAGTGIDTKSVVLSLNGGVVPAMVTDTKASYAILTPLELGVVYKVSIQVADKAGNIASADASFSLELTPPAVSAKKPAGTVSEEDAAKGVLISAKLSDGDEGSGVNPDSVMMWLDGNRVDADASPENVEYTAKALSYGEHTVRLMVSDMLGNVTDVSWTFKVDDTTKPTVVVVSPKEGDVVGVKPIIKISYADEGSGVDLTSISVKVDDNPVMATATAPASPSGAKVVSAGEASYEVKLGYGDHILTVSVKDIAGNVADVEVKFTVEGDSLKIVKAHNYPNPFPGGKTTITFGLSQGSDITIRIYDFTATLVATVAEEEHNGAGTVKYEWDGMTDAGDGAQLANGVYFCKILAKTNSETKYEIVKIALVRE